MTFPPPSVRINNLLFPSPFVLLFNLNTPSPSSFCAPSVKRNSFARDSTTVSSPSSPAPADSARFLLTSNGSWGSADSSPEGASEVSPEMGVEVPPNLNPEPKTLVLAPEPNEKAGLAGSLPPARVLEPNENDGVVPGFAPKLKAGVAAEGALVLGVEVEEPKLKADFDAAGEAVPARAPPNANCGWDPPGPNLPSWAGDEMGPSAFSMLEEGEKVLLSGVAGRMGPAGAKENIVDGFLASDEGVPNWKAGLVASAGFSGSEGFSARISFAISFAADGFFGVKEGGGTPNEKAGLGGGFEGTGSAIAEVLPEAADEIGGAGVSVDVVEGPLAAAAEDEDEAPVVAGLSTSGGDQPAEAAASAKCSSYWSIKLGMYSARSMKGSFSIAELKKDSIETFNPRNDVQYDTSPTSGWVSCDGFGVECPFVVVLAAFACEEEGSDEEVR